MIIVLANLRGEDKPSGIAEWGKKHGAEIVELLQLKKSRMPSVNTYRRMLAEAVCQEELERLVGKYNQRGEHGQVYGLDGKAVRGMRKKDEDGSEYLLSVYDVEQGKVLVQVEVGRKENEISKAPKALESEMLNTDSTWPDLAQVYRLERQFQWWRSGRCYRTSCEVEFGITSLSRKKITPDRLLCFRRDHWGIETGLHYRRDVTFKEDATRMTIGNSGKAIASINNLVIALIHQSNFKNAAQARRWFAAHLPQAFTLLTTPFS